MKIKDTIYFLLAWAGIGIFSTAANFAYGKSDILFFTLIACAGLSFILFTISGFRVVSAILEAFGNPKKNKHKGE